MPIERRRYQRQPRDDDNSDNDPLDVGGIPEYVEPSTDIGVPPGYTTRTDISEYTDIFGDPWGGGGKVERRPQYQDGDELLPANYSPAQIADLQRQMAEVGLLPPNARIRLNVWDETSAAAFYKLLAYANSNGLHWSTALNKMKSGGAGGFMVDENGNLVPIGEEEEEQLPTHTTPAEELLPVFRAAVIDTLGEGWNDDQLNEMVRAYQTQQIAAQRAAYAAEDTTKNVMEMPSPEAFALSQAEEADPERAQAEKGLQYGGLFEELLGGWQGAGMGTL